MESQIAYPQTTKDMLKTLTISKWSLRQQILSPIFSTRSLISANEQRSAATQRFDFFSSIVRNSLETGEVGLKSDAESRASKERRVTGVGSASEWKIWL